MPRDVDHRVRIISMPASARLDATRRAWEALFEDVGVFEAVVGRDVQVDDPRVSCSLYRRMKLREWREPWTIGTMAIHMTNGAQVGCALSHISVWQEVAQQRRATIVVEDDCHPLVASPTLITRHCDADFVSLMQRGGRAGMLRDQLKRFWGCQAYYVTPEGANLLLRHAFPLDMHIDRLIASVAHREQADWRVERVPFREVGASSLDHITVYQLFTIIGFVVLAIAIVMALILYSIMLRRSLRRCRTQCMD